MDPVEIKQLYGDKLSFNGTLGTQTTMPFGTVNDVDRVCREMIEKVGKGGGLILAPTHMIEPEVPWENVEAYLAAIKKYGKIQ
jgi:uroporphyrinogen decarboxylase